MQAPTYEAVTPENLLAFCRRAARDDGVSSIHLTSQEEADATVFESIMTSKYEPPDPAPKVGWAQDSEESAGPMANPMVRKRELLWRLDGLKASMLFVTGDLAAMKPDERRDRVDALASYKECLEAVEDWAQHCTRRAEQAELRSSGTETHVQARKEWFERHTSAGVGSTAETTLALPGVATEALALATRRGQPKAVIVRIEGFRDVFERGASTVRDVVSSLVADVGSGIGEDLSRFKDRPTELMAYMAKGMEGRMAKARAESRSLFRWLGWWGLTLRVVGWITKVSEGLLLGLGGIWAVLQVWAERALSLQDIAVLLAFVVAYAYLVDLLIEPWLKRISLRASLRLSRYKIGRLARIDVFLRHLEAEQSLMRVVARI